jgi:uncharacterized protein
VIIDFHTHIFPPHVRDKREDCARRDTTFAEMYADPKAKIATAEDLLASMDEAGVDVSVALGFAWQSHEDTVRHNEYLLESAARSSGRIVPFTTINMSDAGAANEIERCTKAGARGIGELRPENQGWDLLGAYGHLLANAAANGQILLFHVTESGDRNYPGRHGLPFETFRTYVERNPQLTIVGGHLGGGYYENRGLRAAPFVDTAAIPFLCPDDAAIDALKRVPANRILFGSDFPLISQQRALAELRRACPPDALEAALFENAAELLRL